MCRPLLRTAIGLSVAVLLPNVALAQPTEASAQTSPSSSAPTASGTSTIDSTAASSETSEAQALSDNAAVARDQPADATSDVNAPQAEVSSKAAAEPEATAADDVTAVEPEIEGEETKSKSKNKATLGDDEPQVTHTPEIEMGLRVIAGFRYRERETDDEATYGFQARQVRASMKLKLGKRLYTRLSAEFTDGLQSGNSGIRFIRTANLEYRQSKALRFTVGRFKRPFSYLQLQSTSELPVLDRGLFNDLVIEDSAWGDRGIGAMASGKIKEARLGWALSFTNPSPFGVANQGVDAIARLTWSPTDIFMIGVNGGNKFLDVDTGRRHFQAVGGDVTLHVGGLEWQVEGAVADRPWNKSVAMGITSLLTYTHRLSKNWQLQPTVFAEYADANLDYGRNESLRLQGGLNAIIRDQFRIMPQYKMTTPIGDPLLSAPPSSPEYNAINPWREGYELSLLLSMVL